MTGLSFLGGLKGWVVRRRSAITGVGALVVSPYVLVAAGPPPATLTGVHRPGNSPDLLKLLGPTGTEPGAPQLAPGTRAQAGDPPPPPLDNEMPRDLPGGKYGIPGIVLRAYQSAERRMATAQPGCHLPWWLLAGVGKVESNHADDGYVDRSGETKRTILGPVLNGLHGTMAVGDTDGGKWDGDATWDRAVGPMQFIPASWRRWSNGGDPDNVYDAAMAAGRYLCADGRNLSVAGQRADAVFAYNHSNEYVRLVLSWANSYAHGGVTPISARNTPPPPQYGGLASNPNGPGSGHGGDGGGGHGGYSGHSGHSGGGNGGGGGGTKPGPIDIGKQPGGNGDGGSTSPSAPSTTPPPESASPTPTTESPSPTPTTESPTPTPTDTTSAATDTTSAGS